MNQYYRENGVYVELARLGEGPFVWACGNSWNLVYGDAACIPRVAVMVYGQSAMSTDSPQYLRSRRAEQAVAKLASAAKLPLVTVVFDDSTPEIGSVQYATTEQGPTACDLNELRRIFAEMGLPVSTGAAVKAINDRSSSAFHKWQRAALGAICVSDIDLLRLDEAGCATEMIELKRSFYELEQWTPFAQDFRNFDLLWRLASAAGVRFTIAYNRRTKTPHLDDASRLRLFSYACGSGASGIAVLEFSRFYCGDY